MRRLTAMLLGCVLAGLSGHAGAANERLTGRFEGGGRACAGALYVRTHTLEWNSTYSLCQPTRYAIVEQALHDNPKRVVFRLQQRSRHCRYQVVTLEQRSADQWQVTGYQSLEGFQNRHLPDWSNSPRPERQTLSCLMIGPD